MPEVKRSNSLAVLAAMAAAAARVPKDCPGCADASRNASMLGMGTIPSVGSSVGSPAALGRGSREEAEAGAGAGAGGKSFRSGYSNVAALWRRASARYMGASAEAARLAAGAEAGAVQAAGEQLPEADEQLLVQLHVYGRAVGGRLRPSSAPLRGGLRTQHPQQQPQQPQQQPPDACPAAAPATGQATTGAAAMHEGWDTPCLHLQPGTPGKVVLVNTADTPVVVRATTQRGSAMGLPSWLEVRATRTTWSGLVFTLCNVDTLATLRLAS